MGPGGTITARDPCPHSELEQSAPPVAGMAWRIACTRCGKTIEIPLATALDASREAIGGIIAMTFGPAWYEHLLHTRA